MIIIIIGMILCLGYVTAEKKENSGGSIHIIIILLVDHMMHSCACQHTGRCPNSSQDDSRIT